MFERHALSLQSAQLTWERHYNNEYEFVIRHPSDALEWAFVSQEIPDETDYSAPNTPIIPDELLEGGEEEGKGGEEEGKGGEEEGGDNEGGKDEELEKVVGNE